MIFTIITIQSLICWISSLVFLRKNKAGYMWHLTWFLGLSTLTELTAYIVYFHFHQPNNYWVFNTFLPVEIFFLSWLLNKIMQGYFKSHYVIIIGTVIFSCIYLYESIGHLFLGISMKAKNFSSVYLIVLCFLYYYYLQKKTEYINLKQDPSFWVVAGCFFFYFGSITCDIFFDYLLAINKVTIKPVRYIIFIVLNLILYSCWGYSFLCKYKQTISSS